MLPSVVLLALAMALGAAEEKPLLADPTFERTAQLLAHPPKDLDVIERQALLPWIHHEVELPAMAQFADGSATLRGGQVYLHSMIFPVEAGKTYELSFQARGEGKVSGGFLWWQSYDDDAARRADPHWSGSAEPVTPKDGQSIKVRGTAPAQATRAYVRLIVREGDVVIRHPSVVLIEPASTQPAAK